MGRHHSHHKNHNHNDIKGKKLLFSIVLNILITVSQVIGGLISGSLSLLSDALHNFSDVISLLISYIAERYSKKEASIKRTFGYKRAEIIAAFINATTLIIVAFYLVYEAIERFIEPQEIESSLVIWLAILAIAANGLSVLLLKKESKENMNMRSAYLHLLTDMSASVAVLVGGLLMKYYEWFWVEINTVITQIPEIKNVHHIHIWQLNEKEIHMEAHIDFYKDISLSEFDDILIKIEEKLYQEFGINHVNIQPEFQKDDPKDIVVQD
jgi:cobalt-zinc-cadmium efflux system protein